MIDRQHKQDKAGRLDLLLQDDSEEIRYEVELMLGSVDESHLIRTIEYWDIERRRYPAYDHQAVLIAENITTRFLNVITLFSGSIPIIAIQVNALNVDGKIVLTFLRVVDSTKLRTDDQANPTAQITDRAYWLSRVGPEIMGMADKCLVLINEAAKRPRSLNYNKQFIGLADGPRSNNFVYLGPKKSFLRLTAHTKSVEEWSQRLEQAGMDFWTTKNEGQLKIRLRPKEFEENKALIRDLLHEAVREDESE